MGILKMSIVPQKIAPPKIVGIFSKLAPLELSKIKACYNYINKAWTSAHIIARGTYHPFDLVLR